MNFMLNPGLLKNQQNILRHVFYVIANEFYMDA
jgi:hypothetical protein